MFRSTAMGRSIDELERRYYRAYRMTALSFQVRIYSGLFVGFYSPGPNRFCPRSIRVRHSQQVTNDSSHKLHPRTLSLQRPPNQSPQASPARSPRLLLLCPLPKLSAHFFRTEMQLRRHQERCSGIRWRKYEWIEL
jgi:hypothetical protein